MNDFREIVVAADQAGQVSLSPSAYRPLKRRVGLPGSARMPTPKSGAHSGKDRLARQSTFIGLPRRY
jgi:hypothetical protein